MALNHVIFIAISLLVASSIAARDGISGLPHQQSSAASKTYGGFVNVNQKYGANLYYYFVESQNSPRDPLILVKRPRKIKMNIFADYYYLQWLQGGPGCSVSAINLLSN